jgi:nucleoside-diphosphate-sugar epimerase
MRVFVTGASGTIGSAVAAALSRAGHSVVGLVRNPEKARALHAAEVATVVGTLDAPESWTARAKECEVLIHLAAEYTPRFLELDRRIAETLIDAARKSRGPRLVLYTSGVWAYGNTGARRVDEATESTPHPFVAPRVETERAVLSAGSGSVRTLVIRPGCVYGGRGGMTAAWFDSATKEGAARIVGDGSFRWSMIHVEDLAELYVLAAECPSGGEIFNATDRSRFTVRECAEAACRAAGREGKVVSVTVAEAAKTWGPMAECLTLDQHVDSSKAVRRLGWQPRHAGFADEAERCFLAWKAFSER